MQTHKNPELRASSVVKSTDIKKPASTTPKAAALAPAKKPPRCEAAEGKWFIEYQEDNPSIEITAKDARETVYIYKCTKTTVKVNGKLNSIIIDSCKRVGLVFETTISCVETVNSQSIQIQVLNTCPTVSIDKTDGCQVFLTKKSLNCEIVSAKSSEMNISICEDNGDYTEFPLPEQYKSTWDGKKFVTICTDINC
jgi:adenylyl cyclase-associated protein